MKSASLQFEKKFSPWLLFIFPLAAAAKIIQYTLLPPKFFYDSDLILHIMESSPNFIVADSYTNAAVFTNAVNIFGFSTLPQWSVFYALIFNIVFFNMARKYKLKTFADWFFLFGTCGLLNIYILNLSKDIFQFCVFLIVYSILQSRKGTGLKLILSAAVLFSWGIIFRLYYCLIAAYIVMAALLQYVFKPKRLFFMTALIFAGVLISFASIQLVMPKNYDRLIVARNSANAHREGSPDAVTYMNDVIRNDGNPLILAVNVFLSVIRLMLPVELLFISFETRYFIFIAYQLTITAYYLKTAGAVLRKQATETQILAFCIFIGFLIGSGFFEPDFGSWIRHESASFPLMFLMFFKRKKSELKGDEEIQWKR